MNIGITKVASIKHVVSKSAIRPSIITLVSTRTFVDAFDFVMLLALAVSRDGNML